MVLGLVVIPYFDVNIEGEPLWARRSPRRLQIYVGVFATIFVLLTLYDAWTVLVPTLLVGVLGIIPYFYPMANSRFLKFLDSRPLPWWVMTWFIAVALTLTTVGTFFRGPGWSWVWPWS